jgi:PPOX class probable FMN-dependent enzyme
MIESTNKFAQFNHIIQSEDEILAVMGEPKPGPVNKVVDRIDDLALAYIAKCPYVLVASSGADGHFDVSPKGDPAGFVKVLDDKHIAIPDRLGNRRIDTFHNILANPKVGLFFLIPGKTETLRISGEACVARDDDLRNSMAISGRAPDFAMIVYVERLYMHCAKSTLRAHLWQPDEWPDVTGTPSLAETTVKYAKLDMSVEQVQGLVDQDERERLY